MPKTIMTVDDAATMRRMISFTLRGAGYDVLEAQDGIDALGTLKGRHVDAIISDINMPEMDGLEFTRRVRQLPTHGRTPLILLTTESDTEVKNRGRAAGATGWIVKPFQPDQLVAAMARVLPA
jgi:two-component system chemotaxis response regulator CheY